MDFILKSVTRSSDASPISDLKTRRSLRPNKRPSVNNTKAIRESKENPGLCHKTKRLINHFLLQDRVIYARKGGEEGGIPQVVYTRYAGGFQIHAA